MRRCPKGDFQFVGAGKYGKTRVIAKSLAWRIIVDRGADQKPAKKPWKTPAIRKFDLTEDDRALLRASEDPMSLLLEIRPDIKSGG